MWLVHQQLSVDYHLWPGVKHPLLIPRLMKFHLKGTEFDMRKHYVKLRMPSVHYMWYCCREQPCSLRMHWGCTYWDLFAAWTKRGKEWKTQGWLSTHNLKWNKQVNSLNKLKKIWMKYHTRPERVIKSRTQLPGQLQGSQNKSLPVSSATKNHKSGVPTETFA